MWDHKSRNECNRARRDLIFPSDISTYLRIKTKETADSLGWEHCMLYGTLGVYQSKEDIKKSLQ